MNPLLEEKVSVAIGETMRMLQETPDSKAVKIALEQLALIGKFSRGDAVDRELLKMVNVGLLAVREFEERDADYAELLYEIQKILNDSNSKA